MSDSSTGIKIDKREFMEGHHVIEMSFSNIEINEAVIKKVISMAAVEEKVEAALSAVDDIVCDWIVVKFDKDPVVMLCERCKAYDPFRMNISLDYSLNLTRAFKLTHALCEESV
jgi:hypothetical protein